MILFVLNWDSLKNLEFLVGYVNFVGSICYDKVSSIVTQTPTFVFPFQSINLNKFPFFLLESQHNSISPCHNVH